MEAFILSTSALNAYKRCPKSFELGYLRNIIPAQVKAVVQQGIDFHQIAACYAKFVKDGNEDHLAEIADNDEMYAVFQMWLDARGYAEFQEMQKILHVETPIFTPIDAELGIYLRTTMDLVYRDSAGWIVIRDYKTFSQFPSSLDASLDFQARIYIAVLMLLYKTSRVRFEHVYVRRDLYHTGKAAGVRWTPEESYVYEDIIINPEESRMLYEETVHLARRIYGQVVNNDPVSWYRVDLKGTLPFSCGQCFYKGPCAAQVERGDRALEPDHLELIGYLVENTERNQIKANLPEPEKVPA